MHRGTPAVKWLRFNQVKRIIMLYTPHTSFKEFISKPMILWFLYPLKKSFVYCLPEEIDVVVRQRDLRAIAEVKQHLVGYRMGGPKFIIRRTFVLRKAC
jgi:hypothetical protein